MKMDAQHKAKFDLWRSAISDRLKQPGYDPEPRYLSEPMDYALQAEGKMLRPALCLAAAEAVGGRWQEAVDVAAALEIFHTFTLIHDDIMDGDELRRGLPTLHKAFGENRALLSGDTMLIHVYQLLSQTDPELFPTVFKAFNGGAMDVCKGQGWDMQFEDSDRVTPQQYEMMIDLKTGALIKLACQLGAIMGAGSQESIDALARFGILLGRAFQMQDDLLEVTSSSTAMGKSLGSDVLKEKKTWIWLDLKHRLSSDQLKRWHAIQTEGHLEESHREQLRDWMTEHGTLRRAQEKVSSWIAEAEELLQSSLLTHPEMLKALSDLILTRKN